MGKKLYPFKARLKLQLGYLAPLFLDEIYLQPNVQVASQRMSDTLVNLLRLRCENEQGFCLPAYYGGTEEGGNDD